MKTVIKNAMELVYRRFFCPETELFYEFVIDDENNSWFHLPSVDEINNLIPNPCGWGTGMEDASMNGGSAIDAFICAYEATKNQALKAYIYAIYRGLMRCVTDKGFVARSISPFDGKSHYTESSRDQYTHWIYGILRFYDSELCDNIQKDRIREALVNIAEKCVRDVTEQNDYQMLRDDGKVGLVNKMWGNIGTHEWSRLPMFYLAAFHVTKDTCWQEMYLRYRDEAIENSIPHKPHTMSCYTTLQMQCALRVMYNYDESVREKIKPIMEKNALYGKEKAINNSIEYRKAEHQNEINYRFRQWNKVEDPFITGGIYEGLGYFNPAQSDRKDNPAFYPVREVAEGAIMAAICPDFEITKELTSCVIKMAEAIDFKKHSSIYAPLLLSCAYFLCEYGLEEL